MKFHFGQGRARTPHGSPGGRIGKTRTATAGVSSGSGIGPGSGGGGGGSGFGGGGNYDVSRFNPVHDNLEIGSVIEDWMPRDQTGLNQMWRLIYLRDAIVGPAVDLYSNLPYSECRLTGIDDPAIMRVYQDTMERLDIVTMMPELVREFLMIGRFCSSLIFDRRQGVFTDWTTHDPDFLRIEPIPVRGFDPKIDLVASPALKNFLHSMDPRDMAVRDNLPLEFFDEFEKTGTYKLNPLNTLFVPRRANPYDYVGTSFLTRIVSFWALEKSLIESTVTNARRRTRSILHVTAGLDNMWEPTEDELEAISGLFIQADEDPVGAVVTTRTGVETNEVKAGMDFWKLSDEWAFLTEGKMRALGISDAFLSGDATYNNMETALSVFMESLRTLRAYMDRRVFYEKVFATIARVHGFIKPDARSRHLRGPRIGQTLEYKNAIKIPREDLLMPKIVWDKKLQPEGDMNFLEMLQSADDAGVPVTLKQWASGAGLNLEEMMEELEEDSRYRKMTAEWRKQFTGDQALEQEVMSSLGLRSIPVWDDQHNFLILSSDEALDVIEHFTKSRRNLAKLRSPDETMRTISSLLDGNSMKTELMGYLLRRLGIGKALPMEDNTYEAISEHLFKIGTQTESGKKKKAVHAEFETLAKMMTPQFSDGEKSKLLATATRDVSPFSASSVTGS
ncbi:hypothetical protein LCGC14_0489610 [marine sediment metagenome]|uniref:Portal protein n=1 Tax=marine sediment metagenome TaxID=412755 RepID=A0A0F9UTW7_9ZZZZ